MARDGAKNDPVERAQRKLTKAQMALNVAQEEHAQARVRGKQEIEQARLRAAKWLTKTGKRVDRRAASLAKAKERLDQARAPIEPDVAEIPDAAHPQGEPVTTLRAREQHALDALKGIDDGRGATAGEWQAASGMTEATFLRARKELTERGIVLRDSDARRGAHYSVRTPGDAY